MGVDVEHREVSLGILANVLIRSLVMMWLGGDYAASTNYGDLYDGGGDTGERQGVGRATGHCGDRKTDGGHQAEVGLRGDEQAASGGTPREGSNGHGAARARRVGMDRERRKHQAAVEADGGDGGVGLGSFLKVQ